MLPTVGTIRETALITRGRIGASVFALGLGLTIAAAPAVANADDSNSDSTTQPSGESSHTGAADAQNSDADDSNSDSTTQNSTQTPGSAKTSTLELGPGSERAVPRVPKLRLPLPARRNDSTPGSTVSPTTAEPAEQRLLAVQSPPVAPIIAELSAAATASATAARTESTPAASRVKPDLTELQPKSGSPTAELALLAPAAPGVAKVTAVLSSVAASLLGSGSGTPAESPVVWAALAAMFRSARGDQQTKTAAAPVPTGQTLSPNLSTLAIAPAAAVAAAAVNSTTAATDSANLTAADRAFWSTERGIGFSVASLGALGDQTRLESALQQVSALGFNTIRTWGTDGYTGRILEAITRLNLPIKVQPGIYITNNADARAQIDSALAIINPYADKIVGVSLGNEQLVDWNTTATLTVPQVINQVAYFKSKSTLPVTYDFAGETFLPGASQWNQNLAELLKKLDYVSVHSYAGFFDNRNNPAWTPAAQLNSLKSYEAMLSDRMSSLGLASTPIILGETGWQSTGYSPAVTNAANMEQYYESVTQYVYGPTARFDGMFYFNFTDEAWKGGDDHWGLYSEGGATTIGPAKFTIKPISHLAPTITTPGTSALQVVKTNGSVSLLEDPATGIAYVQTASTPAVEITRADSYWSGQVPLTRGGATLISAALDTTGQLRVLDTSSYGQYGWVLDNTGKFTGEQKYDTTTLPAAETLFAVDLNKDGTIGTAVVMPPVTPPTVSAYELTGFNQGEFRSTIAFSHRATADPIVAPGNSNFNHAHDFFANPTTDAHSTVASLMEATGTAAIPANNISTYWAPSLIDEGSDGLGGDWRYVDPLPTSIAYYSVLRPNEPNDLVNMPTGLKMIAGSAMPMERQSRAQVFWNYIGESASYDHIPLGDEWRDLPLQAVVIFPEFWDGEQLDSANHKSHLAYGNGSGTGPDGHPLLIPQLQLQIHYGRISNTLHLVSSDYMTLPDQGSDLDLRLRRANREDLSFRNAEEGFAPGWSLHADQIHLPWQETAPSGEQVDGFARREADVLRLPLFAGNDGNSARPIPTGITQPYSSEKATLPMLGTLGDDVLVGTAADDRLQALEGNDSLIGAGGADLLVGSDGADRFVLESISDSTIAAPDEIIGFGAEDRLDLRGLNLSPTSIQLQQQGPAVWFVRADGTDLGVRIRTDELTADQIILD